MAATEFAMIIPLFLILTFGTIEICQVIFLKEKATLAAHEGARIAVRRMTTQSDVITDVRDYLTDRGVNMSNFNNSYITVSPTPESTAELQPITVTVQVPVAGNTVLPNNFYTWVANSSFVEGRVVMYKEFAYPSGS